MAFLALAGILFWLEGSIILMAKTRIEVGEDLHRALSIQATKARMTLKQYVASILLPEVEGTTWDFLGIDPSDESVIGEPSAKAEKPKVTKPKLTDNPQALQAIRDLWQSGVRSRAAIGREVGYAKSTVAENIRRMLAAGELVEGEESTREG